MPKRLAISVVVEKMVRKRSEKRKSLGNYSSIAFCLVGNLVAESFIACAN